jgi:tetratricopeptide (TPR) repeat protein
MTTSLRDAGLFEAAPRNRAQRRRHERRSRRGRTHAASVAAWAFLGALGAGLFVATPATPAGVAIAAKCSAEEGQALITAGHYERAIREFTCLIDADPTAVEGYRGRIEANLLFGRYSDALRDFARITAFVLPVHPDATDTILAEYAARLAVAPDDGPALTGASFIHWASYDYVPAIHLLNHLVNVRPDDVYGNLFRGSSRLLKGVTKAQGAADLEHALALAPQSPDVRFIVADAYTYGQPDLERAFAEASLALQWGLDTPRVHAILATVLNEFGDVQAAAGHLERHFELVTTELVPTAPLAAGDTLALDVAPGRTYEIPVPVVAGEVFSITTSSEDYWDTIAVLLAPDGTPVVGSDDENAYFAAFNWVAEETGIYRLQVTFFESVNSGELVVTRD